MVKGASGAGCPPIPLRCEAKHIISGLPRLYAKVKWVYADVPGVPAICPCPCIFIRMRHYSRDRSRAGYSLWTLALIWRTFPCNTCSRKIEISNIAHACMHISLYQSARNFDTCISVRTHYDDPRLPCGRSRVRARPTCTLRYSRILLGSIWVQ